MKFQLVRHGTLILTINNKRILVDPMLSAKGTISPITNVENQNSNPLVDLPLDINSIINCDAILVSHTHRDHFDEVAAKLLPKNIPLFCQPKDEAKMKSYGFKEVYPINNTHIWNEIKFNRTGGQHGHGELALQMAPVSGFIISHVDEPSIYICGDTVWCEEVETAINKFNPEIIACNCGSAQFSYGEPITMDSKDIHKICTRFPNVKIIAVHMEAWNHCGLSRKDLKNYINENNITNFIAIPNDGEALYFKKRFPSLN